MLLRGATLNPRTLNEMDFELMRRHASTHDRIHGLNWQQRDSPRNGSYNNSRQNGNSQQDYGGGGGGQQHMKWFPPGNTPGIPTPGIPPSNVQASQWYQQTSVQQNGGHSSGVLRLEDLQAQFGGAARSRGGFNGGGDNSRGGRGYDRRGGGSGYYQDNRYSGSGSGSGSGYRESRW